MHTLGRGTAPRVTERLGHSTITLTMDVYSHVLPGMQEDAAMKLNKALVSAGYEGVRQAREDG